MDIFLNAGSLLLGLFAWGLPLWGLRRTTPESRAAKLCCLSLACCALALLFQLFSLNRQVLAGDLTSLMDTTGAVCGAAVILCLVTAVLNVALLRLRTTKHIC